MMTLRDATLAMNPTRTMSMIKVLGRGLLGVLFAATAALAQTSQTINLTQPSSPVEYSASLSITLSATGGGSGNPVVFASTTPSLCTVSGNTVTILTVGYCTLTANQAGNGQYSAAPQINFGVNVIKAVQLITGTPPTSPIFYSPGATFNLALVGGGSGNPVTYTITTPSVCSLSGTTVNVLTASTCSLTANQAGNANYEAAYTVNVDVRIYELDQEISAQSPPSPITYAPAPGGTFALFATGGASGNPVYFVSITSTICTVSGNIATVLRSGTCTIDARQDGNVSYHAANPVHLDVVVNKASQTITFNALANRALSDPPFAVSATTSSGLAVTFTSTTTSKCTVSGSTVTLVATGTCTIRAAQSGDVRYLAAANVNRSFTITAGSTTPQAITGFAPATPITYSPSGTFALTATGGGSGNPVVFASTTTSVCTVSGSTATVIAAGTCTLTANQAGNASYTAAPQVSANVVINKANQVITGFSPATPIPYSGGGTFALSATGGASGNAVVYASSTPGVCTVAGSTATIVTVGACALTADQAGNGNYNAAPQVSAGVTINPAAQTIAGFTPATPVAYSVGGTFALSATGGASGNAVVFASTTTSVCTVSGGTATVVTAGTCTLTANQAGNANYAAAPEVTANVVINQASQTITFATLADRSLSDAPFPVSATASSSLTVAFASTTTSICTVSGTTVTLVAAGTCTVQATQAGNTNYAAAAAVSQSFVVTATAVQVYYVHADHLGTPRAITRPSDNQVVWKNENTEPFGNSQPDQNPSGLGVFVFNLRFPGQYYDQETGTHQNWMRDYDPLGGRYIQSDPIGLRAGINTYAYVAGNPLAFVDHDGLDRYNPGIDPYPKCGNDANCRAGLPPTRPPTCMEICMLEKLGLMGLSSAGRNLSLSLAQKYGGLAVATFAGAAKSIWTPAALGIGTPYLLFMVDQCQQKCGLQCDGPPNTTFFFAP